MSAPEPVRSERTADCRVLGPFEVLSPMGRVDPAATKPRLLLATLVRFANRFVTTDALVEALWGETPPSSAVGTIHSHVSRLRKTLAAANGPVLISQHPGYVLELPAGAIDADRFEGLAREAREAITAGDHDAATASFTGALALWRGPALADLAEHAAVRSWAALLDQARLDVVEELAEVELSRGRAGAVVNLMERHLAAHPLRERGWAALMLALYHLGRQAEALRAYQRLRHILGDELGLEPTPALTDLETRILRHDPAIGPIAPRRDAAAEVRSEPPGMPHQALFSQLPPPSRGAAPISHLPVPSTRFIGRRRELDEVSSLLSAGRRLVTITGVGGAGKTRVALEVAARVSPLYPDGVWLVDLAPVSEVSLVPGAVADALGLQIGGLLAGPGLVNHLCAYLGARRLLLLFDSCEHVVESAARMVVAVLERCSDVAILATSREVLGLAGEVLWPIPPLSLPSGAPESPVNLDASDAVALFRERAAAATPAFAMSATNAAAVAQICRRLDGIPLAIELAAARVRVLSVAQIAERLNDRFHLLTGTGREATSRHRTLRTAIDWSYELLAPAERAVLSRLAVFPGTFGLAAAEAVTVGPGWEPSSASETLDVLSRLVDKSLVTADITGEEARYRLLETVRHYALERLTEAAGVAGAQRRHRAYFVALLTGDNDPSPYLRDDYGRVPSIEEDNIRAALATALDDGDDEALLALAARLWWYWMWASRSEGIGWLEAALAGQQRPATPARVEVLLGLARILALGRRGHGDIERAASLVDEADTLARQLGYMIGQARAHFFHGEIRGAQRDLTGARKSLLAARETYARCGAAIDVGWSDVELGWLALREGDEQETRHRFELAAAIAQRGDNLLGPHALGALAPLVARAGENERAQALATEAVLRARKFPMRLVEAMALTRAAETHVVLGDENTACSTAIDLLSLLSELGTHSWVAEALDLAGLLTALDNPVAAAEAFQACDTLQNERHEGAVRVLGDELNPTRERIARTNTVASGSVAVPQALVAARAALEQLRGTRRQSDHRFGSGTVHA